MSKTKLANETNVNSPSICLYQNKYTANIEDDDTFYDCQSKEVGEFSTRKEAENFLIETYGFKIKQIEFFEIID